MSRVVLGIAGCAICIASPSSARHVPDNQKQRNEPAVAVLEKAARHGDKVAQLELGKRYEEGSGVPRNEQKAISLYRRAARTDVRQTSVYSPAVGAERYGRVVQVAQPTIAPGLPEADARLTALRKRLGGK